MRPHTALLSLVLWIGFGCASSSKLEPIDNALLAEVSDSAMAPIAQARAVRDETQDALAVAMRDAKSAKDEAALSKASLKRYEARLEEAKVSLEIAERGGSAAAIQAATTEYSYSQARTVQARAGWNAAKRGVEYHKLAEKLAEASHEFALARVELEKASALQSVDRGDARSIAIDGYRKAVDKRDKSVKLARDKADRAMERLEKARREWDEARRTAEALEQRVNAASSDLDADGSH